MKRLIYILMLIPFLAITSCGNDEPESYVACGYNNDGYPIHPAFFFKVVNTQGEDLLKYEKLLELYPNITLSYNKKEIPLSSMTDDSKNEFFRIVMYKSQPHIRIGCFPNEKDKEMAINWGDGTNTHISFTSNYKQPNQNIAIIDNKIQVKGYHNAFEFTLVK